MYEVNQRTGQHTGASLLLTLGAATFFAACSSSDDSAGPDTTAPSASAYVQNRTLDPTGQTVSVTFNEAVTAATAEVVGAYTISGGVNVTAASLRMNGTTVDLTLDAPAIPGDNTISITASIQDTAGNTSAAVTAQALTSSDSTAPDAMSIAGVTIAGPENDQIVVVFNDDMIEAEVEALANWAIESPLGNVWDATGATIDYVPATRTATITLGAGATDQNLQSFDDIHASFTTMRDLGGNTITTTAIGTTAIAGAVGGDVTPPELMSIVPGAGDTIVLTFNEDVTDVELADMLSMANPTGTEIEMTDVNDPGTAASGTIQLTGTVSDGDSITISDGTTTETFEFDYGSTGSITLTAVPNDGDSATISDGTTAVVFEFDNNAAAAGTSVTIGADADATAANLLAAINADAFDVTATAGATPNVVNLRNDNVGVLGNVMIIEVDTASAQTTTGMAGGGVTGGANTVAVDTASIANTVTNLRAAIDANAFDITTSAGGSAIDFVVTNDNPGLSGNVAITENDAMGVITFTGMTGGLDPGTSIFAPTASTAAFGPLQVSTTFNRTPEVNDTFRLYGIRDLAGNQMLPEAAAVCVAVDAATPALSMGNSTVTANSGEANDEIVVTMDIPLHPDGTQESSNYVLNDGTAAVDLTDAEFSFDGTSAITITLDADTMYDVQSADTFSISATGLRSVQGNPMPVADTEAGIAVMGDMTAPTVGVGNARLDPQDAMSILVRFDEAVNSTTATATTSYSIVGNTTTAATQLSPRVIRVTFATAPTVADSVDIAIAGQTDLAGNTGAGIATVAITTADSTPPTVTAMTAITGTASGLDEITLTWDEPVSPAAVLNPANYSVMSGGAVDLTGATFEWLSTTLQVRISLETETRLDTGETIDVMISGVTDHAGNVMVAETESGTVTGDAVAPATATAFINRKEAQNGTIVDVRFDERMDATTTAMIAAWTGSNGQAATAVTRLDRDLFRVTFDASIGAADTIDVTTPTDLAGNAGATITVNPME